jgi:ABC-2 type transport system permease protein
MLWYKTWLETRTRFIVCLLGMVFICAYTVIHGDLLAQPYSGVGYYYSVLNGGQQLLTLMWILAVTVLTMDGLVRELHAGTAAFTLALPVSRNRILLARMTFILLQAWILLTVPSAVMFFLGSVFGKAHSVEQALFHYLLQIGGGVLFFAISGLCSAVIEGQYTAPAASLGISITLLVLLNEGRARNFNPFFCMIGADRLDRETGLLQGSIPWLSLTVFAGTAIALAAIGVLAARRRDF